MKYKIYQPDDRPEWAKDMVCIETKNRRMYTKGAMAKYNPHHIILYPERDNKNGRLYHGYPTKKFKGNFLNLCCALHEAGIFDSQFERYSMIKPTEIEQHLQYRIDGILDINETYLSLKKRQRRLDETKSKMDAWQKLAHSARIECQYYPYMSVQKLFVIGEMDMDECVLGDINIAFDNIDDALKWCETYYDNKFLHEDAMFVCVAEIEGIQISTKVPYEDSDAVPRTRKFDILEKRIKPNGLGDLNVISASEMTFYYSYDEEYDADWDIYVPSLHDFKQAFLKRNCSSDAKVDGEEYKAEKRLSFYTDPDMYQYMSDEDFEYAMDLQFNEAT